MRSHLALESPVAWLVGAAGKIYYSKPVRYWLRLALGDDSYRLQIHPAEVSAGLTDDDISFGFEPGHLSRYSNNWSQAFSVASAGSIKVQVPGGSYSVNTQVEHTGDVDIEFLGPTTISKTSGAKINSIFKITGKLRIYGADVIFDGQDNTYLLLHCPTIFPELQNITFRNCTSVAVLPGRNFGGANNNDYSGSNGVGHGWIRQCRFENVGSMTIPTGSGVASDTSFGIVECSSDDSCGDITNLFNIGAMGYGYVHGGWYTGVPTTAPNMTDCGRCEYIGGRYENMERGPTTGEESDYVTIVGGISSGMSFSGVSIDARITGSGDVPYVKGKVDWTVEGNPDYGVFAQASGINIAHVRFFGDGTATSSTNTVVRLTDSLDVSIGTITAYDHGGGLLVEVEEGVAPVPGSSAYKTGDWDSDTTSLTAVRVGSASSLQWKKTRVATANTDLSTIEDTLIVDATSGIVDVDVPGSTFDDVVGKVWTVIVRDSTNDVTITRDGGGATAINGGASFTVRAGSPYTHLRIESIGNGNYVVTTPVLSGNGAFTITNETEDRSYDADTVTTAELADVVATLISDLKRGS